MDPIRAYAELMTRRYFFGRSAAGIGTVRSGSNAPPAPTHHVPETTVMKRSFECECGRLIAPGEV